MRFVLVDEILELVPGSHIRAIKRIAPDEDYFRDHFPGFPVVPGVLLTEMMGQAAAQCLLAEKLNRGRPMLAQIKSAMFRAWVRPGQTVTLVGRVQANRSEFAVVVCQAFVEEQAVSSAELLFTYVPVDKFLHGCRDTVLEAFLEKAACTKLSSATPLPD
jgi:3-hydroxyacyl-[acyl-carrier-protein] dehydratase